MHYIRPEGAVSPQLLAIHHDGSFYRLELLHATLDEQRSHQPSGHCHVHEVYHVVLFTAGENQLLLADTPTPCSPGTLVLCPPGVAHDFGPQKAGAIRYHEISFQLRCQEQYLSLSFAEVLSEYAGERIPELPMLACLPARRGESLQQLMTAVVRHACTPQPAGLLHAHRSLLELLLFLIQHFTPASTHSQDKLDLARQQIAARFANPVSIVHLAGEIGLSPEHFARTFKARYGISPLQYRQELRLSAAMRLLQTSSLSCKEIAARLGFADVQTFTKAFVRHHGQPPASMRHR